jgi:hypothetical protein
VAHAPIRIQDERDRFHLPIARLLLEWHIKLLESLTSLLDIIDRDRDVAEPFAGLSVAACVPLEVGIGFSPVVVRQFQHGCVGVGIRRISGWEMAV